MANSRLRLENLPTWEEVKKLWNCVLDRFAGAGQDKRKFRKLKEEVERTGREIGKDWTIYGLREVVFFGILFFTGLRISEILSLRKKDVNLTKRVLIVRQLKKRSGQELIREVLIPSEKRIPELQGLLKEYVIREVKGEDSRLFEFTRQRAWQLVKDLTERELGRGINPHAFRHTFAIQVLKTTGNMEYCRRLLGHKDYNTLKHYLNFTIEDMREEIEEMF
jgi:integrase